MKKEIKQKWVSALRSGEYMRGENYLRQVSNGQTQYCCLGVLCDLAEKEGIVRSEVSLKAAYNNYAAYYATDRDDDRNDAALPMAVRNWAGLHTDSPSVRAGEHTEIGVVVGMVSLAELNDEGTSFEEIADLIEEQL